MPSPAFGGGEERASPPPRQTPLPERLPSVPPPSVAVATYSYEADADDLAIPRTQVVASPTKMAEPPDPLLAMLVDPLSLPADAYRGIRRKLATGSGARVLGVTSAQRGEGKTVCSLNLALALRDGAKGGVLVVDANPVAPGVAKLLGIPAQDCFLAQLARHLDDPRAPWSVAEPLPKLHVLAIDPQQQHPPRLDAAAFSQGMDRLKQAGYEYIVVDAPHVLGSGNANVIADAVDALILTALPMKSLRRQMRKAVEQLEPAPILGVVVLEG
jgi:Mrp family chromosome partitioning ATPase